MYMCTHKYPGLFPPPSVPVRLVPCLASCLCGYRDWPSLNFAKTRGCMRRI
uniref:Uncharacterized protein n=1 Tax=Anguilla anguilla TaxID=7936 RepID=A0A0E9S3C4_ANGAN